MQVTRRAYVIDAVRTPFGRYGGGLSHVRTDDLAAMAVAELIRRNPGLDPARIDDVILGNTNGAGEDNRNVARMAALLAGLPVSVPGSTVNRLCGSGIEALVQAGRAISAGDAALCVAGGVEGMSRAPFILPKPGEALPRMLQLHQSAVGWRMPNPKFPASWVASLGACAERVATELGISREEQDAWALRSHQRAHEARHDGVMAVGGVLRDESIRPGTSATALAALKPAFSGRGAVTAGNSSPLSDGAVAVLLGDEAAAEALEREPLGRIVASAVAAVEPDRFTVAPIPAVEAALRKCGRSVESVDLWEINEAFAAMVLATLAGLPGVDPERVNVNGGAIALGHPLGASAARIVVDLCRQLRGRGGGVGVACACIGVGQGIAMVVEVETGASQ